MGDSAAASLLAESTSLAPSTLERATLTGTNSSSRRHTNTTTTNTARNTVSRDREVPGKRSHTHTHTQPAGGESTFFWGLVVVLLLLASGNLLLTFFAMGVLRLGYGMESVELLPGKLTTKFYGNANLGNIIKKDGIIYGYADTPFSIDGDDSEVSFSLRTSPNPPELSVGPKKIEIKSVDSFQVVDPDDGEVVFSTDYPNFGLPRGVKNLNVKKANTARVTSPTFSNLKIKSDSTIRLKGNEGMALDGGNLMWSADQDIYIRSINGSIMLETGQGLMIDVNALPLASLPNSKEGNSSKNRGQYKLCVCLPHGQLFRVPVPMDNYRRSATTQINCATFDNPCSAV